MDKRTSQRCFWNESGALQFTESLALKAVSLSLAIILWITILGFKREEIRKNVKLEPLLSPGMMITNKIPSYIQFTFSGPRIALKHLEKKLQPISPDYRRAGESTVSLTVTEDLLSELPNGVRVTGFYPSHVLIQLEEVVERYVAVRPSYKGSVAAGYEIVSAKVIPPKVAVSGPRSLLQAVETVGTEALDVEGLKGVKEAVIPVAVDTSQGFQLSREKVVKVRVVTRRVD